MAKVTIKVGAKTETRKGIPDKLAQRRVDELRDLHKCGSCDAKNCNGRPNLENEFVVRGIAIENSRCGNQQAIFDCLGYHKKADTCKPYTPAEIQRKYAAAFSVSPADEHLALEEYYDFDDDCYDDDIERYAELLTDFEEPVYHRRSRH